MESSLHLVEQQAGANAYGAEINTAVGEAVRFRANGLEAYDSFIDGEPRAKEMMLALLTMGASNGMAGIMLGKPGTGKSLALEHAEQIVDTYEPNQIGIVEHRQDLQGAKLIGEKSEMTKHVKRGTEEYDETMTASLEAILHPGLRVAKLDEITRVNPLALNAALKIMQDGRIAGSEVLDLVLSASNNFGHAFTNKLDPAIVSRHGMGTFVGEELESNGLSTAGNSEWDNVNKVERNQPSEIIVPKVIARDGLLRIRNAIPATVFGNAEIDLGKRMTANLVETMSQEGVNMGDPRLARQFTRISRTLALLRGRKDMMVTEADMRDGVNYILGAKLGLIEDMNQAKIDHLADSL